VVWADLLRNCWLARRVCACVVVLTRPHRCCAGVRRAHTGLHVAWLAGLGVPSSSIQSCGARLPLLSYSSLAAGHAHTTTTTTTAAGTVPVSTTAVPVGTAVPVSTNV